MHDLDSGGKRQMESESFFESSFEGEGESFEFQQEQPGVFQGAGLNELAAELLSVANERELNNFLSDLIKKVGQGVGHAVSSVVGQPLGGLLKSAAKVALPAVASVAGNALVPGLGGMVAGKLASSVGSMFGLETEGMTSEDRQYEAAKQFVRFAGDATQKTLAATKQGTPPPAAAKAGVKQAAERFAPGLLGKRPAAAAPPAGALPQSGSWSRHGSRIILRIGRE